MNHQEKDLFIKQLQDKLEKQKHQAASYKKLLDGGKPGPSEIISEAYTCKTVHGKKGKKFRFKPGQNIFRLPVDVDKLAQEQKVTRDPRGIYHARNAIKSPVIMEHLIGVNSGIIEEVPADEAEAPEDNPEV